METKANTALIGAFTLIVLALLFVFIYWMARGSEQTNNAPLTVIFNDPVTGLAVGSQVVFNGINVGTVKSLDLDPENPSAVVAGLSVRPLRSIKADTQVTLGFQGLTGVGYIEMAGGSPDLQSLWETMPDPTLIATRSSMQDLLAGARGILSRTDETLQSLEKVVSDNTDDISQAIKDVRSFTGALAQNSDKVAVMIDQVAKAAAGIADASGRLQGIVDRTETLLAAVDPEQFRATLGHINTTAASLAGQSERFGAIMQSAEGIATDVKAFAGRLPVFGEKAEALVAALDPAQVAKSVSNVEKFTTALAESSDDIEIIVAEARGVSARFGTLAERADSVMSKLDSMAGSGTGGILEDAQTTLAAIREAAEAFNAQVTVLGGGLGDFSDRGLRDFQSFVSEGQRTIARLDRVISNLEQNPSGFLLGGETVPEYGGRRR